MKVNDKIITLCFTSVVSIALVIAGCVHSDPGICKCAFWIAGCVFTYGLYCLLKEDSNKEHEKTNRTIIGQGQGSNIPLKDKSPTAHPFMIKRKKYLN